jgi:hypothetical protein
MTMAPSSSKIIIKLEDLCNVVRQRVQRQQGGFVFYESSVMSADIRIVTEVRRIIINSIAFNNAAHGEVSTFFEVLSDLSSELEYNMLLSNVDMVPADVFLPTVSVTYDAHAVAVQ